MGVIVLARGDEELSAGVVAVVSVSDPLVFVDIAVAFVALVPVSVVAAGVDSYEHPKFPAFPSIDYAANSSSSFEVLGEESVHSSTDARANYELCSNLSIQDPHQNKNLGNPYNNASRGHNNAIDTSGHPMGATTNRSRRKGLYRYRDQHRHPSQVLP